MLLAFVCLFVVDRVHIMDLDKQLSTIRYCVEKVCRHGDMNTGGTYIKTR
jgi:hypothetical protein